ncbi:hypothetical protein N656DRAFT_766907 [Canariomyces notabilis]|uniref:Uncharacterized protein n=1 Tax=Canariomyces notabilis TaxID=2074819 RepID=A0AAN6THV4_9PEZI|nr:hypothetical protein N656DRAFT_766907 [Canariomyces arenarius]
MAFIRYEVLGWQNIPVPAWSTLNSGEILRQLLESLHNLMGLRFVHNAGPRAAPRKWNATASGAKDNKDKAKTTAAAREPPGAQGNAGNANKLLAQTTAEATKTTGATKPTLKRSIDTEAISDSDAPPPKKGGKPKKGNNLKQQAQPTAEASKATDATKRAPGARGKADKQDVQPATKTSKTTEATTQAPQSPKTLNTQPVQPTVNTTRAADPIGQAPPAKGRDRPPKRAQRLLFGARRPPKGRKGPAATPKVAKPPRQPATSTDKMKRKVPDTLTDDSEPARKVKKRRSGEDRGTQAAAAPTGSSNTKLDPPQTNGNEREASLNPPAITNGGQGANVNLATDATASPPPPPKGNVKRKPKPKPKPATTVVDGQDGQDHGDERSGEPPRVTRSSKSKKDTKGSTSEKNIKGSTSKNDTKSSKTKKDTKSSTSKKTRSKK